MSHPNPYLFQINRLDIKVAAGWIFQQEPVRTRSMVTTDYKDAFILSWTRIVVLIMYERVLLYNIFIRSFYVVIF
jgi:hypothetical protein